MTDMAADRRAEGLTQRVSAWIARRQEQFSDHLHADGHALARDRGWTIITTTGRFGVGGRVYRDPRFDQLAANARHASRTPGGLDDRAPHLDPALRPPRQPATSPTSSAGCGDRCYGCGVDPDGPQLREQDRRVDRGGSG